MDLLSKAEHRRMVCFENLPAADIHVDAARQTRIKATHSPHDVDALELVRSVFFEDRRVLNRILVGTGSAEHIARTGVPRRGRIWVIVRDLAVFDDDMV